MTLAPVPGVARLVFFHQAIGSTAANVMHFGRFDDVALDALLIEPWTLAQLATDINTIATLWQNRFLPLEDNDYSIVRVEGVDLIDDTGVVAVDTTNRPGTNTGPFAPAQSAVCVSWQEPLHYRGGHLRTYCVGPTTNQFQTVRTLTTTAQGQYETAAVNFLADLESSNPFGFPATHFGLCGVHRIRSGVQLAEPIVTRVTGAAVDVRIDTQRRRLGPDV